MADKVPIYAFPGSISFPDFGTGDQVQTVVGGRTGTIVSSYSTRRTIWKVLWDEPVAGVRQSWIKSSSLELVP